MQEYSFQKIEKKWQEYWRTQNMYTVDDDLSKPKMYVLDMFPYPSGAGLHVGHPKGYIATDVYSRTKRMQGYNVLHPMGWDAFGLPAENYAIQNKIHPKIAVEKNIQVFKSQLELIGFNFDWSREINTTDPEFYKWTQWAIARMFEHGLMEEVIEPINWCPTCKTGLANEDLEDGKCERCNSEIEKKPIRQWIIKITQYAERLLDDLDLVDWEDSVKEMQRNWIGKSTGLEITFQTNQNSFTVFTTRPDTLFGATFCVLSPEHPLIDIITTEQQKEAVTLYQQSAKKRSEIERTDMTKEKSGVFTGAYAVNPVNSEEIPIYISDYVLMGYGTGAIMAVPAHDERDFAFASKYGIPIKTVIANIEDPFQKHGGVLMNSAFLDGMDISSAIEAVSEHLENAGVAKRKINYKLKDWVFARQRYWGEPFPFIKKADGNIEVVPDDQLPVILPEVEHYEPSGDGESPLANIRDWVETKDGLRETNTMPQWAGSSWYYLRYLDPRNHTALVAQEKEQYWMGDHGVDLYVGGAEHATRHLIYARFWHKFLYDIGVVSTQEPFYKLINVGLIQAEDGRKMSKRWNNVINPNEVIEKFGADSFRLYEMFMGPFTKTVSWSTSGIEGVHRFLKKFLSLFDLIESKKASNDELRELHSTIKKVSDDIHNFQFNTAIAQLMILVNFLKDQKSVSKETLKTLTLLLSPFCPHIAEELYQEYFGEKTSIVAASWPSYEEAFTLAENVTIAVQINGKIRGEFQINRDSDDASVIMEAKNIENVQKYLTENTIIKTIVIPNKLISFVVKD